MLRLGNYSHFPLTGGDAFVPIWGEPAAPKNAMTAWTVGDSFTHLLVEYMDVAFSDSMRVAKEDYEHKLASADNKPNLVVFVLVER